jgi:hypothetical protein
MKQNLILTLISSVFILTACSQSGNGNSTAKKGRIKLTTCFGYEAAEKKGESPKDTLTTKATFQYDEKGNIIAANYYDLKTNLVFSSDKRAYDNSGNMVEILHNNKAGEGIGKDIYKFDDKNHEIEKDNYWEGKLNRKVISTYDYKSMIVTVSFYKGDGSFERKNHYKIDDKGNHLEDYDWDGKLISKSRYEYDDKGKIIKEYSEAWDMNTTNAVIIYKYDEQNNEIMRTITDLNTNIVSIVKTEYVYDKFGNWIKQVITWSWSDSRKTEKREIEYYEE